MRCLSIFIMFIAGCGLFEPLSEKGLGAVEVVAVGPYPIAGAQVSVWQLDPDTGEHDGMPLCTGDTDASGRVTLELEYARGPLLVVVEQGEVSPPDAAALVEVGRGGRAPRMAGVFDHIKGSRHTVVVSPLSTLAKDLADAWTAAGDERYIDAARRARVAIAAHVEPNLATSTGQEQSLAELPPAWNEARTPAGRHGWTLIALAGLAEWLSELRGGDAWGMFDLLALLREDAGVDGQLDGRGGGGEPVGVRGCVDELCALGPDTLRGLLAAALVRLNPPLPADELKALVEDLAASQQDLFGDEPEARGPTIEVEQIWIDDESQYQIGFDAVTGTPRYVANVGRRIEMSCGFSAGPCATIYKLVNRLDNVDDNPIQVRVTVRDPLFEPGAATVAYRIGLGDGGCDGAVEWQSGFLTSLPTEPSGEGEWSYTLHVLGSDAPALATEEGRLVVEVVAKNPLGRSETRCGAWDYVPLAAPIQITEGPSPGIHEVGLQHDNLLPLIHGTGVASVAEFVVANPNLEPVFLSVEVEWRDGTVDALWQNVYGKTGEELNVGGGCIDDGTCRNVLPQPSAGPAVVGSVSSWLSELRLVAEDGASSEAVCSLPPAGGEGCEFELRPGGRYRLQIQAGDLSILIPDLISSQDIQQHDLVEDGGAERRVTGRMSEEDAYRYCDLQVDGTCLSLVTYSRYEVLAQAALGAKLTVDMKTRPSRAVAFRPLTPRTSENILRIPFSTDLSWRSDEPGL
ncbi:hypothetical protein [Haliangium sp.]|uniref:hypothetical protein n=1 Tax=Haliangium sp. TaxID=2663208 RepID=UPI003D1492CD